MQITPLSNLEIATEIVRLRAEGKRFLLVYCGDAEQQDVSSMFLNDDDNLTNYSCNTGFMLSSLLNGRPVYSVHAFDQGYNVELNNADGSDAGCLASVGDSEEDARKHVQMALLAREGYEGCTIGNITSQGY